MPRYGNRTQIDVSCILNGFDINIDGYNINLEDFINKDMVSIREKGNIKKYEDALDILNSIMSKYVVPVDDTYLIRYAINNDESYLLDNSGLKVFYLDEYTVKEREWVYKCEVDDYIFVIDKKIKLYYKYLINVAFDESVYDEFIHDTVEDIHKNKKIQKYEEFKTNLETIISKGEYITSDNNISWDSRIVDYAQDNNETELFIQSGRIIYRHSEFYIKGRQWCYMREITDYYNLICKKIKEYNLYLVEVNICAAISIALLRV